MELIGVDYFIKGVMGVGEEIWVEVEGLFFLEIYWWLFW
jgi:hypothetical protein